MFKNRKKSPMQLDEEDLAFLTENTAADRQTVEAHFQNFLEKHPSGKLTKKEFKSIMSTCYPSQNYEKLEKRIFRMYDRNSDGQIDFREFMFALYIMSNGSPEENLKQIFRIFDENGDGVISEKEMRKIVGDIYHLLDEGGDKEEISTSAFKEMDADSDGKVTVEEFIGACLKHEKMATMLTRKIVEVFDPDD